MAIVLRDYQLELRRKIYEAWESGFKNVLAVCPTGGGKCLGKGTPVLMYDGQVKSVEEIKVGDSLMGPDSKPRTVLGTTSGQSELFQITPIKGDPWVCNDVHMLTLKHTENGAIIDIPLDKYLKETNWFKHIFKQFRTGVNFPSRPRSFDPYLVGLYLAEGTWDQPCITTPDMAIIFYLVEWAKINGMKITVQGGRGCAMLYFSDHIRAWYKNKMKRLAQSCCNQDDRWIPRDYLINDETTRLELLAGLLDGDGHLHNGFYEITTKYDSLNRDILFLARSLGFAAYSRRKTATIKSSGFSGEYYRISISGNVNRIPCKVNRKKAAPRLQKKDVLKTGFSVASLGEGEYYGFELDGDGRFLLGDFTVTHNTRTFCAIAKEQAFDSTRSLPTAIMVHRKELVQQISLTLAEEGLVHNIIAPRPTILGIVAAHRRVLGRQYYDYHSPISVLSVDTLHARIKHHQNWTQKIRLAIIDEAAHVLKENKWGRAFDYFPNAVALGVTATPRRLDKKGLGRHADGIFDTLVEGPGTRWLIENGYLCRYKIAIPPSDYQQFLKRAGANSDYSKEAMAAASKKSHIVGDVVTNYQRFANGKQAILFATDIATARLMERRYNDAGIKAITLTGESSDKERLEGMLDFRAKKIKVLINVDLFDEGLDVPGIECVIMARPTMSLSKFLQMVGRGLRTADDKPHLILIDHVGNVTRHGLPDSTRSWTLDRYTKRTEKTNFIRICSNIECNSPYDRLLTECPWCGTEAITQSRGENGGRTPPVMVDGDLELIDPETLHELELKAQLDDPAIVAKRVGMAAGPAAAQKAMKDHQKRIETQKQLVHLIAKWAGRQRQTGLTDRMIHKKFYLDFDGTITEKLGEPRAAMQQMIERLNEEGIR
jgi:superfamily II DNA or RNA helicase